MMSFSSTSACVALRRMLTLGHDGQARESTDAAPQTPVRQAGYRSADKARAFETQGAIVAKRRTSSRFYIWPTTLCWRRSTALPIAPRHGH